MRSGSINILARTTGVVIFSVIPPFMVGVLSGQMRSSFRLSPGAAGMAISVYFLTAALVAIPMGWLVQRIGPETGLRLGSLLASLALGWIALVVDDRSTLAVGMVVAGAAGAIAAPASNILLQDRFPRRFGLAMGIKQAAPPGATFLAGLAVPTISLRLGWRWAFAAAAVVALGAILIVPRRSDTDVRTSVSHSVGRSGLLAAGALRPLLVLTLGATFATTSSMALVAHAVDGGTAVGLSPSWAGTLVAVGSGFGVAARILSGARADRRRPSHLGVVIWMMGLGALALGCMSIGQPLVYVIACPAAFASIWGWNAVFYFAIGIRSPERLGLTLGIVQSGVFAGGIFGPALFGLVVERWSYHHAWLGIGVLAAAGAMLVQSGRSRLRAALQDQAVFAVGRDDRADVGQRTEPEPTGSLKG